MTQSEYITFFGWYLLFQLRVALRNNFFLYVKCPISADLIEQMFDYFDLMDHKGEGVIGGENLRHALSVLGKEVTSESTFF